MGRNAELREGDKRISRISIKQSLIDLIYLKLNYYWQQKIKTPFLQVGLIAFQVKTCFVLIKHHFNF